MENWLVNHAISNVWCKPAQDRRWFIEPRRISKLSGETFGMQVTGHSIRVPDPSKWYDVFQLGNINHRECGIEHLENNWISLSNVINASGTLLSIYDITGRTYPLHMAWIRKLPNSNVIIAVERVSGQISFSTKSLYLRIYDGYFRYTSDYTSDHKSECVSMVISTAAIRHDVITKFNTYRGRVGAPIAFVNGYERETLTSSNIALWDVVDIVYDGLVKSVDYFEVSELKTFISALDGTRKYLIHPAKQSDTIEFYNDIDIYIQDDNGGRYYHQHTTSALRQLTHQDYSIPAARITELINQVSEWSNKDDLLVKLVLRRSGMERELTYETNRIHELYKLSDADIEAAMTGVNSNVPEWQASNLESSSYNKVMASSYPRLTKALVTDAYGYNAVSKYAADTPTIPVWDGGKLKAVLPGLLSTSSTVYEYDADGTLLGYYNHLGEPYDAYTCAHNECVMVEAIAGQGGEQLDIDYNATDYKIIAGYNHRFYVNVLLSGTQTDEYIDVTDTDAYSIAEDGTVVWDIDQTRRRPCIWRDSNFLTYGFELDLTYGLAKFSIDHYFNSTEYKTLFAPTETLEIWLNGKILVPNIDYFVKWPQVVVCNKEHLGDSLNTGSAWIDIRARGLAESIRYPKTGYVVNGLISNNGNFDLRDDKVVRVGVYGALYHRDDVVFREDASVSVDTSLNGKPYLIEDATIPLRTLVTGDTYVLRDAARAIDKRVENYLSVYYPTPENIDHNPITSLYTLTSPIMSRVITDMVRGILIPEVDDGTGYISTQDFDALMEPYRYLLDYDPILNSVDLRYVTIHPHYGTTVIELKPLQYSIIDKINDRYLSNQVIINKHLRIKA